MVVTHILVHSLIYAVSVNAYLFMVMITISPRVWGYADYPAVIKNKVAPQTRKEKRLAALISFPWLIFVLGFPAYSTYVLKSNLGGSITFWMAFLNLAVMFTSANIGDLILLDWLIVSKVTPKFVIIPGSEVEDYKDFSHHYKGHARATIGMVVISLIMAGVIWHF